MKRILVAAVALVAFSAQAGNYADCILDKMPGTANAPAAFAVNRLCTSENPGQYFWIEKGSGRGLFGLFGFDSSEACIIKKSRDTMQSNAALMIAAACRCLYDQPTFKSEQCAYQPQSFVPAPPQEQPAPVQQPTPAAAPSPAPVPQPYTPPAPRKPSAAELARQAEIDADLKAIAERASKDYPYLETPAGAHVLTSIVERRDELIRQGVYPSIALTRAVAAFAPAHTPVERPATAAPVEAAPEPVTLGPCRWVSSIKWSCQ